MDIQQGGKPTNCPVLGALCPSHFMQLFKNGPLTKFGQEVDESVRLTVPVKISQLRAAVQGEIVDTESPLARTAGVQHSTLQGGWSQAQLLETGCKQPLSSLGKRSSLL